MEFSLSPFYQGKSSSVRRVPYLCKERYDGSSWASYPSRQGRAVFSLTEGVAFNQIEAIHFMRVNTISLAEQESFLQTWLYFGLIAEFLGANSTFNSSDSDLVDNNSLSISPTVMSAKDIFDIIYDTVLVQDGESMFVVLDDAGLQKFVDITVSSMPKEPEAQMARYLHLNRCLAHAQVILITAPKDVSHNIRFSIAAVGEVFMSFIIISLGPRNDPKVTARPWANHYLDDEVNLSMIQNGWCPSDISRCMSLFSSFQSLNVINKMDKSLPPREHTSCTDFVCHAYQINMDKYQVGHLGDGCECGETLVVDSEELTRILFQGDQIPLLRIVGGLQDMTIELVESTSDSKYIAISHVWADGLGNPFANALHRCKLLHLRELVAAVAEKTNLEQDSRDISATLIWIDTLCCPASDGEGKRKGIEKIYNVYEKAEHVLVLDSCLMSYAAEPQDISERALRIFTSPWMRRLWTLQEGALAKSLYFQFADGAVSLQSLYTAFTQSMSRSLQHRCVGVDVIQEFFNITGFFHAALDHTLKSMPQNMAYLDRSLKFRGVSVPTDEPLCIGALMRLDLRAIINVERKEDRMQMMWTLLAKKIGGLPAQVIFMEEHKIDAIGWRWAPSSLIQVEKGLLNPGSRGFRWAESQLGMPTERGFRVRYPGYCITLEQYDDDRPRNPWPGLSRISESYAQFRDAQTGQWYCIVDKKHALMVQSWTNEQEEEYNKLHLFPLHDLADTNHSLILMSSSTIDAMFVSPNSGTFKEPTENGALHIKTERHIMVSPFGALDGYLSDTIQKLALRLREDKLTDAHLDIFHRLKSNNSSEALDKMHEDEDFKASLQALKQKMKDMITEVITEDKKFVQAVLATLGESSLANVWVLIQNYFRHGYIGTKLSADQVWFVD
ncbi:hypothetical protein OIDMADRAFT_175455 [Oidiodendron maius Zn]|uniref:Heterokaryon incompatibility domain-containing protein n=1 Tax=Oidiodendron maius (strain Zn) TaxID=913774 RepID=A0A0C3E2Y2_OIDMZ|nr:hypothetical protein OIDMADRAFT_175455 [Oidiodendron maius Zn]